MQAIITAAGQSSRFYPFTDFGHKSFIPVLGKPIIYHTLESLKLAGIKDVVIIIGKEVDKSLIADTIHGLSITYIVQPEPLGLGNALLLAQQYLEDEFFVLYPHHVDFQDYKKALEEKSQHDGIVLLGKKEDDLSRFGVLKLEGDRVLDIIEKPKKGFEPSNIRVIGMYLLCRKFLSYLKDVSKDHYNFEEAVALFAKNEYVKVHVTDKAAISFKYPWDLFSVSNYLFSLQKPHISKNASISKSASVFGNVVLEDGVVVKEGAVISGQCYIGKNSYIGTNALVRDGVSIGQNCVIGSNMEVKNSVILDGTTTHSGFIGDSVIGKNTKIAAYFCSGNVRLDRKSVKVKMPKEEVDSGRHSLGVIIGSRVNVGIRVSTMPGITIGNDAIIGPGTTVMKNIDESTLYYAKYKEIIEENRSKTNPPLVEKLVLFDIDHTLFDTDSFKKSNLTTYTLFEETLDVILALKKFSDIGIFSEGEIDFQKMKLKKTLLYEHFAEQNVHIFEKKDSMLADVLKKYDKRIIFLVDDKLNILKLAKEVIPSLFTIWVKRGPYAKVQKPIGNFKPDATVVDLKEVAAIVKGVR